jgi:hypothetical protein
MLTTGSKNKAEPSKNLLEISNMNSYDLLKARNAGNSLKHPLRKRRLPNQHIDDLFTIHEFLSLLLSVVW